VKLNCGSHPACRLWKANSSATKRGLSPALSRQRFGRSRRPMAAPCSAEIGICRGVCSPSTARLQEHEFERLGSTYTRRVDGACRGNQSALAALVAISSSEWICTSVERLFDRSSAATAADGGSPLPCSTLVRTLSAPCRRRSRRFRLTPGSLNALFVAGNTRAPECRRTGRDTQ